MEILSKRCSSLAKALATLKKTITRIESKKNEDYEESRDSLIQRFEYCADIFWKVLKDYLRVTHNVELEAPRPKAVFKECADVKILTKQEFDLSMNLVEDRNVTSHGYNEFLAEDVSRRIPSYYKMMLQVNERILKQSPIK